jgi:hypothetical protein
LKCRRTARPEQLHSGRVHTPDKPQTRSQVPRKAVVLVRAYLLIM